MNGLLQKTIIALFGLGTMVFASEGAANAQEKRVNAWGKAPTDVREENPVMVTDGMFIDAVDTRGTEDPSDDAVIARDTVRQGYYQHNIPVYTSVSGKDSIPEFYNAIHFDEARRVMYKDQELNYPLMSEEIPIDVNGHAQQSTELPDTYFDSSPTTSLDDTTFLERMKVFPNPGNDYRKVSFNLVGEVENLKLNIYNGVGQLVHQKNLGNYGTGEHLIEVYKELVPGSYILELRGKMIKGVSKIIDL